MDISDFFKNPFPSEMKIKRIKDHWVTGIYKNHAFEAKVYSEPSEFGILDGCVSKLCVLDKGLSPLNGWAVPKCVYNYDRGIDVDTNTKIGHEIATVFDKVIDFKP